MASEFETGRNMKTIGIAIVVIAIVVGGGVVLFLNSGGGGTTGPTHTLTVLTRHDVAIHNAYETAFLQTDFAIENNIVDIQWKTQDGAFWDDVIAAGGVDVLWGGGPTLFDQMQRDGNLQPLTSTEMLEVLDRVPDEIAGADMKRRDTNGSVVWVAAAISTFGFTINHAFLDAHSLPTPNNWTHLAQPVWGSLLPTATIAMGNAPKTTSNTRIYEIITQGMGWDNGWITLARMAGSARLYQGSVETQAAVENQEVGVAMSIDFYGYSTQANNPDCEYVLPEGESIVNGDPIAIVKDTPQMDLAEGFLDFVLSAEGQAVWFSPGVNRMPVLESAFQTPEGLQHPDLYDFFNQTKANVGIDFNDTLSLQINTAFTAYFEAVYNDAHDDLVDTWKALVDAYDDGHINITQFNDLAAMMGTPVNATYDSVSRKFTVEFAKEINDQMINDAVFYYDMQTAWTAAARTQYAETLSALNALLPPP
ncbi:MAG: ABC transporter substrate-binding protein [Candidatus Thorarchaeota archaeon]|nr:MAG: ABC transporter substrate-binding protein [Candidatus Thorarchaeota archaeon]RLI58120.1 MAG: ABC transporter substrate-binding protein [Candidatus Thorarchaeota archaeon]